MSAKSGAVADNNYEFLRLAALARELHRLVPWRPLVLRRNRSSQGRPRAQQQFFCTAVFIPSGPYEGSNVSVGASPNACAVEAHFVGTCVRRDRQFTGFIPGKESKELRIMAISHNREIQSSSTTDFLNIAPTCGSIYELTCPLKYRPGDQRSAKSTFAKKHLLPTQLWTSADARLQCAASHRHKLPNAVASRVRQRSRCRPKRW